MLVARNSNQLVNPAARQALNNMKMEVASSLGVDLSKGAQLTTAEAGRVGGQMVKRLIERAESSL